jgi:hypothetical protein
MSILMDVPDRKHFEDSDERGAFGRWMRYSIGFAVLFCLAALLLVFFMDSKRAPAAPLPEKEPIHKKLPVVADLPSRQKTASTTGSQPVKTNKTTTVKSGTSGSTTPRKIPTRKTTKTN